MNLTHSIAIIAVMAVITFALRALPFAFGKWLREQPVVRELSLLLPIGVMTVLVVYSLRDTSFAGTDWVAPTVGVVVTAGLHLWRWNILLSLVGGIGAYGITLLILAG